VYRPTVLTILGLMMYVREGWVVGEAGLLGALLIIIATFVIRGRRHSRSPRSRRISTLGPAAFFRSSPMWVTDQSPDWELGLRLPNLDLPLL